VIKTPIWYSGAFTQTNGLSAITKILGKPGSFGECDSFVRNQCDWRMSRTLVLVLGTKDS
jgi:hypothetical protein